MAAAAAAERLERALAILSSSACGAAEPPTVSALCELAKISRNSLYRYHREVIARLRKLQRQRERSASPRTRKSSSSEHSELLALRHQRGRLVALVDHYYAAYRESRALLERREQELAELRRRLDLKPATLRR